MTDKPPISDAIAAVQEAIKTLGLKPTESFGFKLWVAISYLSDYERVVAERDELRASLNGHNEPCVICGEPVNSLAGNQGLWPVRLGNDGWRHVKCINKMLAERDAARAELAEARAGTAKVLLEVERLAKELAEARAEIDHLRIIDRQRLEQIDRLQETIEKYQSGAIERLSAPPEDAMDESPPNEDDLYIASMTMFGFEVDPEFDSCGRFIGGSGASQDEMEALIRVARALTAAREAEREKYRTLVEAASPFVKIADGYDAVHAHRVQHASDEGRPPGPNYSDGHRVSISLGEARAVRSALAALGAAEKGGPQ